MVTWSLLLSDTLGILAWGWHCERYLAIMCRVYMLLLLPLEYVYFEAAHACLLVSDSPIHSGIYGFYKALVGTLFHALYAVCKYGLVAVMLLMSVLQGMDAAVFRFGMPFLMQVWLLALFFTRNGNRPRPRACTRLDMAVMRPLTAFWWGIAASNYAERNPKDLHQIPSIARWMNEGKKEDVPQEEHEQKSTR